MEAYKYEIPVEGEINRKSRDYIRWVQRSLNRILGINLVVDGILGPKTRSAIRAFQRSRGLTPDGIVGLRTERALVQAGAQPPHTATGRTDTIIIGGIHLTPPSGLRVRNYLAPSVHHFTARGRAGRTVNEIIIHESVTRSMKGTVNVLRRRGLSVHFIVDGDGVVTQHGDLLNERHSHAAPHNTASVGIEVVNPYYPGHLRKGLPWSGIITAGWAHKGRYVLPTQRQAEALSLLVEWLTSPSARGLSIPRTWIGARQGYLAMGRMPDGIRPRPGIYAHTYFRHADGAWLVLYTWLRLSAGFSPVDAYTMAVRMAATGERRVRLVG